MIKKKIAESEVLETPAGTFFCYRIEWLYDINYDGRLDDDIHLADYYSAIGLVRRSIKIQDLVITDENSPDGIGVFDYSEEYQLINYQVK